MSLLALAVCVCMAGSSLEPVAASIEPTPPAAEEQTTETPIPTETVPAEEEPAVSGETEETEDPELTETPEPTETPAETAEPSVASEGPAKDIVDAREAEGGPKANYAYYSQDVVFEETTDPVTQKTARILKIDGVTPDEKMIVGVVNEDNSVTYYAYAPKEAGLPEGAICMNDVYNLGVTDSDWYAFDADGHMVISDTYMYSKNQNTYYFKQNGKKHIVNETGCQKVEGVYCFFKNTQGAINTAKTCFKNIQEGNKTYTFYFDEGVMVSSQMVKVDSYFYYLDGAGHVATGRQNIDGKYYLFRTKKEGSARVGSAVTGWYKDGDYWYFYRKTDGSGVSGPGIEEIGSHKYYFTKTGKVFRGGRKKNEATGNAAYFFKIQTSTSKPYMLTNRWIQKGSAWYYAQEAGKLAAGKKKITNSKGRNAQKGVYYFDEETNKMLKNTTAPDKSGWLDDTGRRITKGWIRMNGNWRYLSDGQFVKKGWKKVGGYYYWFKKGYLCQDLRKKYKKQKRSGKDFRLEINRKTGNVTVLTYSTAKDGTSGQYIIPVVMFRCSVGNPGTPTPLGTWPAWHVALSGGKWKLLSGPTWGQWAMGLVDGVLLHSTPGPNPNVYSVPRVDYNRLGYPASHGCIRFCVHDMKWLWDNVNGAYTRVYDGNTDTTKFEKPPMVPMAGSGAYGVDPTDPSVAGWKAVPHKNPY